MSSGDAGAHPVTGAEAGLPAAGTAAVIHRLFGGLSRGDVAGARACVTDDLVVWHGYDRLVLNLEEIVPVWHEMLVRFAERSYVDVRRSPVPGGWVQRHQMLVRSASGERMAWPACLFVTLQDGLIARLDEYIDVAGRSRADGG